MNGIILKSRANFKFNQINTLKNVKIFNQKTIVLKKNNGLIMNIKKCKKKLKKWTDSKSISLLTKIKKYPLISSSLIRKLFIYLIMQ